MPQPAEDLAQRVGELLAARGAHVATFETTAGGLASALLVGVPGASAWFERGAVAYSREAKVQLAGVEPGLLARHGAVSPEVAVALARGFRDSSGADYVVSETGIAGPQTGRRSPKPAGSAVIAVAGPNLTVWREFQFVGSRREIMAQIARACLELLVQVLGAEPP